MARLPFHVDSVQLLPTGPGVYVFYDERGKPLYVGKAQNLKSRVRSYFAKSREFRLVTAALESVADALDFIVTSSAKEALLLENSLIKKHAPRLNIRLRDDKTYFSLMLDLSEEWPRLRIVRKRLPKDVLYFGPYPSARACRQTIRFLSTLFPIRTCSDSVLYNRSRPCILKEIGRCAAPCVDLIQKEPYDDLVQQMVRFLRGQNHEVVKELEQQMLKASEQLEFEKAAELRDRIQNIRTTIDQPQVTRKSGADRDVIGLYATGEGEVVICTLHVRDGSLESSSSFTLRQYAESDELLSSFLGQFYSGERTVPPEILLPGECADPELHREILEERRGASVVLRVPEKGEGLRLLRLAEENAQLSSTKSKTVDAQSKATLSSMKERFGLVNLPKRVECYDISHLGGEQVVASGVVFVEGRPEKALYRRYRLKEVQRNDDFAAMDEVLRRRFRRGLIEGDFPDLIVIDGGAAQLGKVTRAMEEMAVSGVDVIGLAKARSETRARQSVATYERVYLPDREAPIILERAGDVVHLLQRIRDEAHRFAITYNRRLRAKEKVGTVLEHVPGIGRRRARALLKHFGSLAEVKEANEEALLAVPGITRPVVTSLKEFFAK